jgi:predicted DsbA family dithiol-disulfide isomerase
VRWVYFPLHPETPPEGNPLTELFAGRNLDIQAMHARMKGLMDAEGLPYGVRTHTYNSRLAQELGKWAETQPGSDGIHEALFRAYFVEGLNISRIDVLLEVVRSLNLPEEAAREALEKRTFKDAVDADWTKAREYRVTGVPTFVSGSLAVAGAQPYETLERFVRRIGAEPKGSEETV